MPKILQINTVVNTRSTGRIAEQIGVQIRAHDWESYIAYGRLKAISQSEVIKIGNRFEQLFHVLLTRCFDLHGFGSKRSTRKLIRNIERINPDIIHIHNIHGYYLNIEILFQYFEKSNKPIIWTLHDCWSFTGHCSYFEHVQCFKWQNHCNHCPQLRTYPSSILRDNSFTNFDRKNIIFNSLSNLTLVPVSDWLARMLDKSFLSAIDKVTIKNGVDLNIFKPNRSNFRDLNYLKEKILILGVASKWEERKGLRDFELLRDRMDDRFHFVIIGLEKSHSLYRNSGFLCIERTENVTELANIYSACDIFFNPTYEDNFPTTNLEALACGTPVVTYDSGGSSEALDEFTGCTIKRGSIDDAVAAIIALLKIDATYLSKLCRDRAKLLFDKDLTYANYLNLYKTKLTEYDESGLN